MLFLQKWAAVSGKPRTGQREFGLRAGRFGKCSQTQTGPGSIEDACSCGVCVS